MKTLRNVFRKKLRATLTIFGIMIGVFALVVMGSIAEKLNLLVDGGVRYYGDKVIVTDNTGGSAAALSSTPISLDKIAEIEKVEGVARASGTITMLADKEMKSVSIGMPDTLSGSDDRGAGFETFKLRYVSGRALEPGETGKAVVGADLVKKRDAKVGNTITIQGKKFEVVGQIEKTFTAPDSSIGISLADAQSLYVQSLPKILQGTVQPDKVATSIVAYPKAGVDPEVLVKRIEAQVPGIKAQGPAAFRESVVEPMKPFNAIILGIALVSLLVGSLSIINTMIMSVSERTREIGIRKAIGASDSAIVRQFLSEAATIGLLGGLLGVLSGWAFTSLVNVAAADSGLAVFLMTPRLVSGSLVFAILVGIVSGFYPAFYAARLNPVQALRYE